MRRFALTLVPLLFLACDRELAAPAIAGAGHPAFNWMNNPDNGNFRIFRFQDGLFACWTDPATGLRACHATIPLGDGTEPDCGLQTGADPADWQAVLADVDAFRIAINAVGRVWITVRDENNAGDCFDAALVAEGWGSMHYTDNDLFGTAIHNANAWGFIATGNLTTTAGASAGYSGHARFRGNNSRGFLAASLQVNLR